MTRTGPPIGPELYAALGDPESGQSLLTLERVGWLREVVAAGDLTDDDLRALAPIEIHDVRHEETGAGYLVIRPKGLVGQAPAVVSIHGGGMVAGSARSGLAELVTWIAEVGAVLVSIDYRLAPEHPYPIPLEDCLWALASVQERAAQWAIDPDRLVLVGGSAGANLVGGCILALADRGQPIPTAAMMWQPMLDDRLELPSTHELVDDALWDRRSTQTAWTAYLAGAPADGFAAPGRARALESFPPTFLEVGQVDIFRDDTLAFASRLSAAGVLVELHLWPGAYHGFEGSAPNAHLTRLALSARYDFLDRALRDSLA